MSVLLCVVLAISDGDSMRVHCDERKAPIAVRLQGIDAPEIAHSGFVHYPEQPYGMAARAYLVTLCPPGSRATVHTKKLDRYGRTLAAVQCGTSYVSEAMVQAGFAWSYMPGKRSAIPTLEANARAAHVGLWAGANPIPPSTWRANHGETP